MKFKRHGIVLKPGPQLGRFGMLNPACARLRDRTLQLYPRMVASGNVSRIGSFRGRECRDGLELEFDGFALEPEAQYELRDEPGGHGCEDPRVTFIAAIDRYVMAYVAFGPRGAEVAVAISEDGLQWHRLGLMQIAGTDEPFADKDAAFFPEPVSSPGGVESLAFYHRPTLQRFPSDAREAIAQIKALPPEQREGIAVGYVPLSGVRQNLDALCIATETHRLTMPPAGWGTIKVGAGAPPVRIDEGWLSVIHGVDELSHPHDAAMLRYCAGVIIHDAHHIERIVYRSPEPLFVPATGAELHGAVGHVVFPTGIDRHAEREFDIYYGMADYEIGCGRLTLD
ncbi:MAG TPA: hypothetical protein VGG70_13760 [Candidatus Cybelea sp.]|jgi:predicted GH43/DUF377 family glycosyl hydrolase